MAVGWSAMSVVAITTLIALWFDKKRGLAISLAFNGASFGGIVGAPALLAAIEYRDSRRRYGRGRGHDRHSRPDDPRLGQPTTGRGEERSHSGTPHHGSSEGQPDQVWTRARALRSLPFWTITAPFALALLAQVGFLVHLIAMLEPSIGRTSAGLAISVITIAAVVGRVGLGLVIDRLDRRLVSALSLASQCRGAPRDQRFGRCLRDLARLRVVRPFGRQCDHASGDDHPAGVQRTGLPAAHRLVDGDLPGAYAFGPACSAFFATPPGGYSAPILLCAALDAVAAAIVLVRNAGTRGG
jgi:hypothetical protein